MTEGETSHSPTVEDQPYDGTSDNFTPSQGQLYYTYEELAKRVGITEATLRAQTDLNLWVDRIDMSTRPSTKQRNSYAGCIIDTLNAEDVSHDDAVSIFRDAFADWKKDDFERLGRAFPRELLKIMRKHGVVATHDDKANTMNDKLVRLSKGEVDYISSKLPADEVSTAPRTTHAKTSVHTTSTPPPTLPPPQTQLPVQQPTVVRPILPNDGQVEGTSAQSVPYDSQTYATGGPTQPRTQQVPEWRQQPQPPPLAPRTNEAFAHRPPPRTWAPFQHGPTNERFPGPAVRQPPYPGGRVMFRIPPTYEVMNERLPPEKMMQFQKTWKRENNYTGAPYDILLDKVRIFAELCHRLEIDETQYTAVFPDILAGRANQYYLQEIGPGQTWKFTYDKLHNHFDTKTNHQQYWSDWTTLTFARCKQENPDKSMLEVLEIMIDKITLAQRALGIEFQGETMLHTAIVRACRGQPELEPAMFNQKESCEGLYSDLRAAVQVAADRKFGQYIQNQTLDEHLYEDTYYTDRKYNSFRPTRGRGNFRRGVRGRPSLGRARLLPRTTDFRDRKRRCFVCGKEGCWSSKHPKQEFSRAKQRYINECTEVYNTAPSAYEVKAYILDYEGASDDDNDYDPRYDSHDEADDDDADAQAAVQFLTTSSYLHRTTGEDMYSQEPTGNAEQFTLSNQYSTKYQGELWDTGAAAVSTVGKAQLEAYIRENPRTKIDWTPGKTNVSFGGQGHQGSIGTVRIDNPIGTVTYYILNSPTPFLLSLADADRLGAYFNNISNVIVRKDNTTIPVVRKWGHPFFNVGKDEASYAYFTETELRRLHRRFGHPRTDRLHRMLTQAGHDVDESVLREVEKFCHQCQSYGQAPRRFKFTLKDDMFFNYEIIVDIVRIDNRDVLHVIDADTSFQAATFLKSISAYDTWDALCKCWINTYQGPPDYIVHDPGTNFASEEFRNRAKIVGVECRQMPVEAHWAVGKIERAHAPLRRTYNILKSEIGYCTDDESLLQIAVKALNDTAGPHGLVPTLLVFGAYPRINTDSPPSPNIIARANAVRKAMRLLAQERAKVSINRAINTRNGPSPYEVLKAPLGTKVLVWREKKGWQGPYELKSSEDPNITIELENGPVTLRATHAKIYHEPHDRTEQTDDNDDPYDEPAPIIPPVQPRRRGRPRKEPIQQANPQKSDESPSEPEESDVRPLPKKRGRPRKHPLPEPPVRALRSYRKRPEVFLTQKEKDDYALAVKLRTDGVITTPGQPFEQSDRTEMDSLMANGTFEVLRYDPAKHTGRIFNLRLVREIKGKTTQPYEKSRLVLAGHSDEGKQEILTQAPTIQRMSQRLILAIGPTLLVRGMKCELRDITQAYVQSIDKLERMLLARPPHELKDHFPQDTILRIVRPLYGAAESGLFWFKTYHAHHKEKLLMKTSSYDPCLLITDEGPDTFGITGMQTDDTLSFVTDNFSVREEEALQAAKFRAKAKTTLTETQPIEFNGGKIVRTDNTIILIQKGQADKIRTINPDDEDAAQQYVAQRARGAYVASVCQPEAVFDLSTAAQITTPTRADIDALNVRLKWQIDNPSRGLCYIPLDFDRTKLFIFTDGSFANNKDLSSQLGFVIVLATERRTTGDNYSFEIQGNIVHWNSVKCKRVTRSVLASELYGMVHGFDCAIALGSTLNQIVRTLSTPKIPIVICTDSKSLYDCLVKLGTTNEKRLMIDIMSLRESYENREISEIRWINGKDNPADACTKKGPNGALARLISTNKLNIKVEAFVDRRDTAL